MSAARTLGSVAAAASILALASPSFAYCLTRTCDPMSGTCAVQDQCIVSGKALYWPNSCISFAVQKDGSKLRGISAETLDAVVTKAFAQWQNADCGGGRTPSFTIFDYGLIDCAKPEYNKDQPNANVVTFHDGTWEYTNTSDTLALTTVFFDGDTGEIYDANIEINSYTDQFSDGVTSTAFDLNAVLTHEAGHFLGLSHNNNLPTATMYNNYSPDMSTLEQDDMDGICASLPPNRATASASCVPRHGFSGECGTPQTGCCSTAVGSTGQSRQPLALLAFGFGLCAWRARKRLKRAQALPR